MLLLTCMNMSEGRLVRPAEARAIFFVEAEQALRSSIDGAIIVLGCSTGTEKLGSDVVVCRLWNWGRCRCGLAGSAVEARVGLFVIVERPCRCIPTAVTLVADDGTRHECKIRVVGMRPRQIVARWERSGITAEGVWARGRS